MRNPHGYAVMFDPDPPKSDQEKGLRERDIVSCYHCRRWVKVRAGEDVDVKAPKCSQCDFRICQRCKAIGGCTPIELACELLEAPRRRLNGRLVGPLADAIRQDDERSRFLREVFGASL